MHVNDLTNQFPPQVDLAKLRFKCGEPGRGEDCVHYVLGQNTGVNKHICPMGHLLTQYADEEYRTILNNKDWTCTLCGKAQHGIDGTCCGFEAQVHLHERIKEFAEIAANQRPDSRPLESGKVKDMAHIMDVILSPHGRTGQGLIPGG